jgi:hypothetical protein
MNAHIDPNAAHACYSPSSAHRWTVCTASATAIAALGEQEEGEAAAKGTAAHEELERCLTDGVPDYDHVSAYGIALAVDFVRQLPPGRTWVEQRVALTDQIWGRLDFGHWHAESETLTVLDLKDGFVDVSPVENEQERIYAASLIHQYRLPAKWIRYVICQPNSIVPGPRVKQFVEPAETLLAWAADVALIPVGPLTFVAGQQCKYCPLFGLCSASQDVLMRLNVMLANPADAVPAHQVALFKACEKPVTDWFKSLDKAATKKALAGSVPPGMKLVATVKHRAWRDEAAARMEIVNVLGESALELPTPAQAEKLGMAKEDVAALADTPPGGPALAFESDRRATWAPKSAAEMFAGVAGMVGGGA